MPSRPIADCSERLPSKTIVSDETHRSPNSQDSAVDRYGLDPAALPAAVDGRRPASDSSSQLFLALVDGYLLGVTSEPALT